MQLSFLSVLTIVFIVLKLCNVITWSWLWVLAPTWIPLAIFAVGALVLLVKSIVDVLRNK